ncbi:MAG TPA: hypothetical protein VN372_11280 [Methanospirillum sp.]|nr:hypothetical protein [Methanospirillum sp.]
MDCPVCGRQHLYSNSELVIRGRNLFSPCPECNPVFRDKSVPPDDVPEESCRCGRIFIDDLFVRLYHLLSDAGILTGKEPLAAVGTPLIDPGIFLRTPPHLPPRTLLLISKVFDDDTAEQAFREIPQISAILKNSSLDPEKSPSVGAVPESGHEHRLLCGCDVRADLFPTASGPVTIYKKQGASHIEFPRGIDPKMRSVENAIAKNRPDIFIDACSGSGTLGLAGIRRGVSHVILNDPWYAAAFFSGFNLLVNQDTLGFDECSLTETFSSLSAEPLRSEPFCVAEASGPDRKVHVYQGAMECLPPIIKPVLRGNRALTVFDPFDKSSFMQNEPFLSLWKGTVGGEVFIP